jgi:hypothetical protein
MARRKSYEAVPTAEVLQLHLQTFAKFNYPQQPGRPAVEVICDFANLGFRRDVAIAFAAAFQQRYASVGGLTCANVWARFCFSVVPWFRLQNLIDAPLEVLISNRTRDLFHLYAANRKGWNPNTAGRIFGILCTIFEAITLTHPALDFSRKFGRFEGDEESDLKERAEVIPPDVFEAFRKALMLEIKDAWARFQGGRRALAEALEQPETFSPSTVAPSLQSILNFIVSQCDGIPPNRDMAPESYRKACARIFSEDRATQQMERVHSVLDGLGFPDRHKGRMRAIAARYPVSVSALKSYGTGKTGKFLPLEVLRQLAANAEVSLEWLLYGEGDPTREDTAEFLRWSNRAIRNRSFGASGDMHGHLYATCEGICAYIAFLATETGANTRPMFEWGRDILVQNVFMQSVYMLKVGETGGNEDITSLHWDKGRAAVKQKGCFTDVGTWGPVNLIRQVLAMTEPIRRLTPPEDQDLLFIAFKGHASRNKNQRYGRVIGELFRSQMARIAAKYDLPVRYLNHKSIRATVLSQEYQSPRGLLGAQAVANHVSAATTVDYLDNVWIRKQSDELIGELQHRLESAVRLGDLSIVIDPSRADAASSVPEEALAGKAVDTDANVTLAGGVCRDVRGGYSESGKTGEVCPNWWSCFGCAGAVLVPIPRFVARWIQLRDHFEQQRERIHPVKWREFYEPKLLLARARIASVKVQVVEEAMALVGDLPPLPDLQ